MKTPMASTHILENLIRLMGQVASLPLGLEKYESGWRKGDYKISASLEKLTPIYKQIATLNADGIKDRAAWFEN